MKEYCRILSLTLAFVLAFCGFSLNSESVAENDVRFVETVEEFEDLDDEHLLDYLEASVYRDTVAALDSSEYLVQEVNAVYISAEYLEELDYNSQTNVFFGYSLADIYDVFGDEGFVFTLGENGETVVERFVDYDERLDQIIKNVAIGSGVILICVVVSVVSYGAGAPAVSAIFAVSAKTGAITALVEGGIGGTASAVITGIQTGDARKAVEAGLLSASEGYKWGAIGGAVNGGLSEYAFLKGCTLNGLTMDQAAMIQMESGYPMDVISQFQTYDQYKVCWDDGLRPQIIDNRMVLVRPIDLNYVDEHGMSNLQRMLKGLAAIDPKTGTSFELHHLLQKNDGTIAILTEAEHRGKGMDTLWHVIKESEIDRAAFNKERSKIWKAIAEGYLKGGAVV